MPTLSFKHNLECRPWGQTDSLLSQPLATCVTLGQFYSFLCLSLLHWHKENKTASTTSRNWGENYINICKTQCLTHSRQSRDYFLQRLQVLGGLFNWKTRNSLCLENRIFRPFQEFSQRKFGPYIVVKLVSHGENKGFICYHLADVTHYT